MNIIVGNLTHQVTHRLGRAIVQGEYLHDSPLPTEAELSRQFDISRSIIREAIKMLSAKGLLSSRPRQGIRLRPISDWNLFDTDVLSWTLDSRPDLGLLREFTQLRVAIEPEAAAMAAEHGDMTLIDDIETALQKMTLAEAGEGDSLEADIDFHSSILAASNNRFFAQFRNFVTVSLRVSIHHTNRIKSVRNASAKEHKTMYLPIRKGDADAARHAVKQHLHGVLSLIDASIDG